MAAIAIPHPPQFTLGAQYIRAMLTPYPQSTTNTNTASNDSSTTRPPNTTQPARASHVLPTVRCTSCSALVPLSLLADHVCSPANDVPDLPRIPSPISRDPPAPAPARTPSPAVPIPQPTPPPAPARKPSPISLVDPPRSRSPAPSAPISRAPSSASSSHSHSQSRSSLHSHHSHHAQLSQSHPPRPPPNHAPPLPPITHLHPSMVPPTPPPSIPDMQSGGSAGMAGVGRRAFAAAAQAAMFAQHHQHQHHQHQQQQQQQQQQAQMQQQRMQLRPHGLAPVDVAGANAASSPTRQDSPSFLSVSSSPHSPLSPSWQSQRSPAASPTHPPARTPSPLNPAAAGLPPRRPSDAAANLPPRRPSDASIRSAQLASSLRGDARTPPIPSPRPSLDIPESAPVVPPLSVPPESESPVENKPLTIPIPPRISPTTLTPAASVAGSATQSPLASPLPSTTTPKLPFFEKYKQQLVSSAPSVTPAVKIPSAAPASLPTPSPSTSAPSVPSPTVPSSPPTRRSSAAGSGSAGSELAYRQSTASSSSSARGRFSSARSSPAKAQRRPERSPTDPGPTALRIASFATSVGMLSTNGRGSIGSVYSQMQEEPVPSPRLSGVEEAGEEAGTSSPTPTSASGPVPEREQKVKLPQRSYTTPSATKDAKPRARTQRAATDADVVAAGSGERTCMKCGVRIPKDGRWVSQRLGESGGGGVLCETDWKEMYLPKCRRCNLPIERHAVSSMDGQLRGKYHRECFNCDTCREPFPDKTFYVYDGRPYCSYHYHQQNGSLCASPTCGQPIEGPCAVTHQGQRFHPEHLVCDAMGCDERLEEYWEVGGERLCERHGVRAMAMVEEQERVREKASGMDEGEGEKERERRAARRKTRFVDLVRGLSAGKK